MGETVVFEVPLEGWISAGTVLIVLLFVLWIAALVRIGRLKRRLNAFVDGSGMPDLESVMRQMHERMNALTSKAEAHAHSIEKLEARSGRMKSNVGVVRYNPFDDRGSDLSFSVAFLDDREDGVVISALHSRDESRVYAKPLEAGASGYPLTPEEKQAISQAKRKL
ncbi:DUF4446 family protein [Paenibacillus sp.]|uniref:DUF4446 family protein n=1 Tax=Paenibacillus sp. TaxID=58172 RepID=UPI0028128A2C|nr:DUF4446 family protein [Paenibacillus sp.]